MNKSIYFLLALLMLAVFTLAGCSGAATTTTADKPFAGVTINYLTNGNDIGLSTLLPAFEKQTGIKVNITDTDMTGLYDKLNVEFGAKKTSFDVAEMMWAAAQGYMRAGDLLPLDNYIKKYHVDVNQYASVYVRNHMFQYPETADGQYIALPHQADIQILAYRADLFDDPTNQADFKAQYGYPLAPPTTYQQFMDIARFFTRDTNGDGTPNLYGTCIMGGNYPSLVGDVTPYLRAFGGGWINSTYHPIINSAASVKALQFYYDLWKDGLTPPAANTYTWDDEIADFQNGKIAMMQIWPGQVTALENPTASSVAGKIKYAVVPGKVPTVGGWAVAISKFSQHPEAAFVFANWLTSTKTALAVARSTGFSTAAAAVYTDPQMRAKYDYIDAFNESLKYGKGWPQIGEFTSIWQIGAQEYSRVFSGEITVQEAADNMEQQLDKLMRDGGYYK